MALSKLELPRWSKRVNAELSGRDPLGLSRVSFLLADHLLPGIITTTHRARYYAIYCWIIRNIEQEEPPEDFDDFVGAFQRREAAFALGTLLNDSPLSPIGITEASARLEDADETLPLNFQLLSSSNLGGYSQNYSGCMRDLMLIDHDQRGIPVVRSRRAQALADAVEVSLGATPFIAQKLYMLTEAPRRGLEDSAPMLDLGWLQQPGGEAERELITDMLTQSDVNQQHTSRTRRDSLMLLLESLLQSEQAGAPVPFKEAELCLLYFPTYYGEVVGLLDGSTVPFEEPVALRESVEYWRMYCAHQYLTQALERLLHAVLEVLDIEPAGLSEEDIVEALIGEDFTGFLSDLRINPEDPRSLLEALGVRRIPDEPPKGRRSALDPLSEASLCRFTLATPGVACASAVVLLGVLYARWRMLPNDAVIGRLRHSVPDDLWLKPTLPLLDEWFECSWIAALRTLVTLVLRHHDKVMYVKGRLDSCWLHREGNAWVKDQDLEPMFRSPRVIQALDMMSDLGLVQVNDEGALILTPRGRAVLADYNSEAHG